VTRAGNSEVGDKLALRPTSETLAYSIFAKWITSYRDLPLKINFWNTALRAEIKATKPFIRTSEFLWQEGHTVHATEEEAEQEVMMILDIYRELIEDHLAVPAVRGFKSDKEKFVGAKYTTTLEGMMPVEGKALQMGTSHHLAQNFSKPFEIKYLGRDTKEHFAWQTSWGVSWRLIGAIIMVHGDDKGLILPPRVAPIQVIVVPIHKDKDAQVVKEYARAIADELKRAGVRAHVDDRDEYTSGWKFNEWELKGVPLRVNVGPRDIAEGKVEFVRRDTREKKQAGRSELVSTATDLLGQVQSRLYDKARRMLADYTSAPADYGQFKGAIGGRGGFAKAGWCGSPQCELAIKEETGADIRVIPFDQADMPEKCIYCGQLAKKVAMFGRAY